MLKFLSLLSRAQDLYRWSGQRGQDDHPLPVSDERGGAHFPDDRIQRGGGRVEEHSLHHVGPRRTGLSQGRLEHLLLQHGGEQI